MIDPQVVHGGASSWFCIDAPANVLADLAAAGAGVLEGRLAVAMSAFAASDFASTFAAGASAAGSFMFTPARNCASGLRNFVAIQRKM